MTAAALVCCLMASSAMAGTELAVGDVKNIVGLQSYGVVGASEGVLTVPKFDTMGGVRTLTSVQVLASLTVSGPILVRNNGAVQKSAQAVAGAGAGVGAAFSTPSPTLTPKPNWTSTNTMAVNPSTSSLITFGFAHSFDLTGQQPNSFFEGPGSVTVNLAARLLANGQVFTTTNPSMSVLMAFPPNLWRATLELRVVYTYSTGPVIPPIPLPSAGLMGALGLGVVAARRRR